MSGPGFKLLSFFCVLILWASSAKETSGALMPVEETLDMDDMDDMDDLLDKFLELIANPDPYMGALSIRPKRNTDTMSRAGFKEFLVSSIGAEIGVKYERQKGGEAFIHVDDLQSLIPWAHSKKVELHVKLNGDTMNSDIDLKVTSVPGKSITAVIVSGGVTSVIEGVISKPSSNEIIINIVANIRGVQYNGLISGKMEAGKSAKLKVEVKKGSEAVLQILFEVKHAGSSGKFRSKYSIHRGKVAQGKFAGKWRPDNIEIEAEPYKLIVDLQMRQSIKVKLNKSGVEMWTYKTLWEGKSLNIKSNIRGGLEFDINHTSNSLGGRTINVLATEAGAQMFKYHGDTSMVNNATMLKIGLKGEFDLNPNSIVAFHSFLVWMRRRRTMPNSTSSGEENGTLTVTILAVLLAVFLWRKKTATSQL